VYHAWKCRLSRGRRLSDGRKLGGLAQSQRSNRI
jgi:hypothetical protein